MSAAPRHVHPTAPLAPRALLTGDPGRALALAQTLTSKPKMFNHNRGLWGYSGEAEDGEPLTIMSHGIGGPSAAIVLEELCDLGLERAIRIGSCGALSDSLELGQLICADNLIGADGTSKALIGEAPLIPDQQMTSSMNAVLSALKAGSSQALSPLRWRPPRCLPSPSSDRSASPFY